MYCVMYSAYLCRESSKDTDIHVYEAAYVCTGLQ